MRRRLRKVVPDDIQVSTGSKANRQRIVEALRMPPLSDADRALAKSLLRSFGPVSDNRPIAGPTPAEVASLRGEDGRLGERLLERASPRMVRLTPLAGRDPSPNPFTRGYAACGPVEVARATGPAVAGRTERRLLFWELTSLNGQYGPFQFALASARYITPERPIHWKFRGELVDGIYVTFHVLRYREEYQSDSLVIRFDSAGRIVVYASFDDARIYTSVWTSLDNYFSR
ncbi:hypothetical protein NWFMUON74_17960 [Nocardia wallacei]|uniref:Uncharacterized protein n=2 Tax=Nocardia wallacei TaxID=480035 RepID=A0A7G1KL14_9NOCA|nr:hypothetical protein NWFMUON74_17960 [Nocardia wallacei]